MRAFPSGTALTVRSAELAPVESEDQDAQQQSVIAVELNSACCRVGVSRDQPTLTTTETTFKQIDSAILDRLPFRGRALAGRSRIAVDLFGQSTNADVSLGRGGSLFYRRELRVCKTDPPGGAVNAVAHTPGDRPRRAGRPVVRRPAR